MDSDRILAVSHRPGLRPLAHGKPSSRRFPTCKGVSPLLATAGPLAVLVLAGCRSASERTYVTRDDGSIHKEEAGKAGAANFIGGLVAWAVNGGH